MQTMRNESKQRGACPSELVCSTFADGELTGAESLAFSVHLETCARCQGLVQAFRKERTALAEVMGDAKAFLDADAKIPAQAPAPAYAQIPAQAPTAARPPVPAQAPAPAHAFKVMGLVIGFAALLRLGIGWIAGLEFPWSIDWLNPLNGSGQLSLMFSTGTFLIQEGGSIMTSLISDVGLAVLFIMLLVSLFVLLRKPVGFPVALGSLILAVGYAQPAEAIDIRTDNIISVEAGEIVDDTLVAFGQVVRIDGEVTGDLIVFAQTIEITGSIRGDVYSFGRTIETDGDVGGGFAGFGQMIRIGDTIGQSVYGFAQTFRSGRDAAIEGDLFAFGEAINVGGVVARNVTVFGNTFTLTGEVRRDVTFGGRMAAVQSSASIGGNLDVGLPDGDNLELDSSATVGGETIVDVHEPSREEDGILSVWTVALTALWLAAAFLSGMLLLWALPALRRVPLDNLGGILASAGIGFLIITALPILSVVLAVTIIGLPAGLVIAAVWALGLYVSKIVVAHFLGNTLLRPKRQDTRSLVLPLLLGLVLVLVAVSLPYVGWVINLLLVVLGLGAIGQAFYRTARHGAVPA